MAVAATALDKATIDNVTTINTASVSPATNALLLLAVNINANVSATATGLGLTWVAVTNEPFNGNARRLTLLRALGTPTAGAITIAWDGSSVFGVYTLSQFTGVVITGTNGSGAVVQSAVNAVTAAASVSVTLAAFGAAANATYLCAATAANRSSFGSAAMTVLNQTGDANGVGGCDAWENANDTGPSVTFTGNIDAGAIGIEIAAAAVAAGGPIPFPRRPVVSRHDGRGAVRRVQYWPGFRRDDCGLYLPEHARERLVA